ncbi:MAG: TonB-dependent receptor [Candidatus Zixiibacteriota bacterium]
MKQRKIFKVVLAWSIVLLIFGTAAFAGTTGKIAGIIKDTDTGERLPGVAITIEGTTMGAAANEKGEYFILNVTPGIYKLKANLIGYTSVEVDQVQVLLDLTTTINFELSVQAVEVKGVTVTAERLIFEPDLTSTAHITTAVDLIHRPVINTDGIIQRAPGVVFDQIAGPINQGTQGTVIGNEGSRVTDTANPGITLRGGRPQEVVYMVDGLSITDPILAGQATNLNQFTISESQLIASGFNAEYGNAMSGIVNYVTQEGGAKLSGRYQFSTDHINVKGNQLLGEKYDFGTAEHFLNLGGPVPGTMNELSYYLAGNLYLTDDWSPRLHKLPHHQQQTYRLQGKLTYKPTPAITLRAGGFLNRRQYQRFNQSWLYNLDGFDCTLEKAKQLYVAMTHNLSKRTFYELKLGYFNNDFTIGRLKDRSLLDRAAGERTQTPEDSIAFVRAHEGDVWDGQWWKDYEFASPTPDTSVWDRYQQNQQLQDYPLAVKSMFVSSYDTRNFQKRGSNVKTLKFDITSQVNFNNQIKSGFEVNSYKITRHYNSLPWDAQPFIDIYTYKPLGAAFYVQDKVEFQGLIVNVGGRVDYLRKEAKVWDSDTAAPYRPDLEPDGGRTKKVDPNITFSPRLGISHPVSDNMTIFFNYGHFTQQPRFLELYATLAPNLQRANNQVGNPDLKAARNIQYELGMTRAISRDMKFNITAYYKDVYNMTQFERIFIPQRTYDVYKNLDYANVKGMEITLSQRPRKYVSFDLSYVLQYALGTNSDAADQYEFHSRDATDPVTGLPRAFPQNVNPLDFDQRHSFVLQGDLRFPQDFKLVALRSFGINVVSQAGSGLPYTKRDYKGNRIGKTNEYRKPWTYNTDLTVDKSFEIMGRELNVFVQVMNLFDRINILNIYPMTGRPDEDGFSVPILDPGEDSDNAYWNWIMVKDANADGVISAEEEYVAYTNAYKIYAKDPMNYGPPRQIKVGFYVAF